MIQKMKSMDAMVMISMMMKMMNGNNDINGKILILQDKEGK